MNTEIRYEVISCGPDSLYRKQIVDFYLTEKEALKNAKSREKSSARRGFNFKYIVEKREVIKTYIH